MRRGFFLSALLLLALAFFVQGFFAGLRKSLTWDEPLFLVSGYTYLVRNDFRLNPEAPPLLQELAALPLVAGPGLDLPDETSPAWQAAAHVEFARDTLRRNGTRLLPIALAARLPNLLLGSSLVVAIGLWASRLYGPGAALVGAAAAAFSPNLLAHAGLATTDVGCAAFLFFAVHAFTRAVEHPSAPRWLAAGALTGLALLTKYTALLLGPIYLVLLALLWRRRRIRIADCGRGLLFGGAALLLVLGAGYNLSFDYSLYWKGLRQVYANAATDYQFYLLGDVSHDPWWYYYLVAFALKTPLPELLLLAVAAVAAMRDPELRATAPLVLAPAAVIFAVTCFDPANLGLRRVLPALPFLYLFSAQALANARARWRAWAVAGLVAWTAAEAVRTYPHHLSYFNALAGGPERGPYLLDDSNVDWGQDLLGLARWQREHPESGQIRLLHFGNVDPPLYGVDARPMTVDEVVRPIPGVTYAVSAHRLASFRKMQAGFDTSIDWLTLYRPFAHVGYSIYLYRFSEGD